MEQPKVAIGISSSENARYAAFYDFLSKVERPAGTIELHARGANIAENRNALGEQALAQACTHLWYVDDDQLFRPDALTRLLAHEEDIVSGLYLQRARPFAPQLYDSEDADGRCGAMTLTAAHRGLIPVLAAGAGCFLVRTAVLAAMERPWWRLGQIGKAAWGDDLNFCHRARAAGWTIFADLDVDVGHLLQMAAWPRRSPDGGCAAMLVPQDGYSA